MDKFKAGLTKKLGPLPRWAWVLIVLVIGIYVYRKRQAAQAQASQSSLPNDPYSSYNSDASLNSGQPYDAYGGTYPVGGGLGSGFDPTSFQQGLDLGAAGVGSTSGTANDGSNSTNGAGAALPPASGGNITVNVGGGGTSPGGSKGTTGKKKPTASAGSSHNKQSGAQHPATSTGGGQPNRHKDQHTKAPRAGTHKTSHPKALSGGGTKKPDLAPAGSPIRRAQNQARSFAPPPKPPKRKRR